VVQQQAGHRVGHLRPGPLRLLGVEAPRELDEPRPPLGRQLREHPWPVRRQGGDERVDPHGRHPVSSTSSILSEPVRQNKAMTTSFH
jgi:hypothetical protein